MTKFAVTGGGGFIGNHIGQYLLSMTDADLVLIDNNIGESNPHLEVFRKNPRVKISNCDISNKKNLAKTLQGVEGVFHCAAYSKIADCIANPETAYRVNVLATGFVLDAAIDAGVKRVVYSSSSSIYGRRQPPQKEDDLPDPINPYAETKYIGEVLCSMFSGADSGKMNTVSLRYFNVYGSLSAAEGRVPCPSVVEKFLRQAKTKQPLTIVGDGKRRRDFVYVGDVARANYLAMFGDKVGRGEVINIGCGKNWSVAEIADLIGGERTSVEERYPEPADTLADISLAEKLLGWRPSTALPVWINAVLP